MLFSHKPLDPNLPRMTSLNDQGIAAARRGDFAKARLCFEQAIAAEPHRAPAYTNLANVLQRYGDYDRAESALRIAICLEPADADHHFLLARLLAQRGRLIEALVSGQHATRGDAPRPDAWRLLAEIWSKLGDPAQAVATWERLLIAAPQDAAAYNELGNLYQQLGRIKEAEASYEHAAECDPTLAVALANRARLLSDRGDAEEAKAIYIQSAGASTSPQMHLAAATVLPVVYDSLAQIEEYRDRLVRELDRLYERGVCIDPTQQILPNLFYLAYQGLNDRHVMTRFARLLTPAHSRAIQLPEARPSGKTKLRLGIVCKYLSDHTIGRLNLRIVERLPRDQFEIVLFKMSRASDDIARRYDAAASEVIPLPEDLPLALAAISSAKLDILFYPEIGMDPLTFTLAANRLAPIQVSTWGHPDTSGLATMDAFLSTVHELPEADEHYSEKLIRLPRLGVGLERPTIPQAFSRDKFGLPSNAHLYGCMQSLFKFHPAFDAILQEILERDPLARLLLIDGHHEALSSRLKRRFAKSLRAVNDQVVWLPRLSREQYREVIALCDVTLDPPQFGGGHTSYEALAYGVPVVTLPSPYLRGRLTYAMLSQLGLTEAMVARDERDYANKAVALASDKAARTILAAQLRECSTALFDDKLAIGMVGETLLGLR